MQHELTNPEQFLTEQTEQEAGPTAPVARRAFVEPEISAPVDVLEATTFFNSSTSGAAN